MMRRPSAWIHEVEEQTGLDRDTALRALGAVLQTLRDELTVEQNERLGPHMPAALRELYFEDWNPANHAVPVHDAAAFVERVRERMELSRETQDVAKIVHGILRAVERHMPVPAAKVRDTLPKELRALWPFTIAEERHARHEELTAQEHASAKQAQHAEDGHERGAPMAPHQNRTPGEEHRGGPLPNRM